MKLYLLCELNDENYTSPIFSFHKTHIEAKENAINACKIWNEDCEVEDEGLRMIARYGESFYITEIKEIDASKGSHILIWHHAYNDVNFEVRHQGTLDECDDEMKKEIQKLVRKLKLVAEDINDNIIDTGDEWEIFDIVEIKE